MSFVFPSSGWFRRRYSHCRIEVFRPVEAVQLARRLLAHADEQGAVHLLHCRVVHVGLVEVDRGQVREDVELAVYAQLAVARVAGRQAVDLVLAVADWTATAFAARPRMMVWLHVLLLHAVAADNPSRPQDRRCERHPAAMTPRAQIDLAQLGRGKWLQGGRANQQASANKSTEPTWPRDRQQREREPGLA